MSGHCTWRSLSFDAFSFLVTQLLEEAPACSPSWRCWGGMGPVGSGDHPGLGCSAGSPGVHISSYLTSLKELFLIEFCSCLCLIFQLVFLTPILLLWGCVKLYKTHYCSVVLQSVCSATFESYDFPLPFVCGLIFF